MKKPFVCFIAMIVLSSFAVLISGCTSSNGQPLTLRMFHALEDFNKLEEYTISVFTPEADAATSDLSVNGYDMRLISYDEKTYKVFAYVFSDVNSSQIYFERVTGKETKADWNYSLSGNILFKTRYIVYYNHCAYLIEGEDQQSCTDFINWLSADFAYELS